MTSRERVINTLNRKPADRTPVSFDLTSQVARRLEKYYGLAENEIWQFIGDDLLYVGAGAAYSEACDDYVVDEFQVMWDRSDKTHKIGDAGSILRYPLPEPEFGAYTFPGGSDPLRFKNFPSKEMAAQSRFVIMGLTGLFDICWHLRGFENFLADMASDGGFAEGLLDKALTYSLDIISCIPPGVDGVRIGEDWGLQKGLITGAALWRKMLKPRLGILYEAVRRRGLRLFIHSCGDIVELFPDLIELGVEAVNPIQPEAMNIRELHREYGKDIVMYGGLGSQSTLVYGTPSDVIAEARDRLELFKDGGYILGPAGAVPTDASDAAMQALVDFVREEL